MESLGKKRKEYKRKEEKSEGKGKGVQKEGGEGVTIVKLKNS